jgi:sugar/nucleoside kinase (ribokinase family)
MSIVVVGSMAFDSLETPFGSREQALGGSANYFSIAAAFFSRVQLVAVVGEDFPANHIQWLEGRGIETKGLARAPGKTFHWKGKYGFDLNEAITLDTQLNVFATFKPVLPDSYKDADTVFLANIDPELQLEVLEQVKAPRLVAMDTMNFWIKGKTEALRKTISKVDMLFVNDSEARQLSGEHNIVKAARAIQKFGARKPGEKLTVVVKRGEYGALCFRDDHIFFVPAYPLEDVFDPTGAGDTFAGGFMGWLDRYRDSLAENVWRQAMVMGSVMASYVVEDFSFDRMRSLKRDDMSARWNSMHALSAFQDVVDLAQVP